MEYLLLLLPQPQISEVRNHQSIFSSSNIKKLEINYKTQARKIHKFEIFKTQF